MTEIEVQKLRELACSTTAIRKRAPPGYEDHDLPWDTLTPAQTAFLCVFIDGLREIRRNEIELLRMGTVDLLQAAVNVLRELRDGEIKSADM